ncbi:hypothetical protein IAU60_006331 [Kwoniella sp. DSM 27419]
MSLAALTDGSDATPLVNQVAGHDGIMSDASGSLVIKMINSAPRNAPLRRLKPFVPKIYGTLRLEGQLSATGTLDALEGKAEVPELGTVLYGPDATEAKRVKMDRQARETTTHETGLRLTGCQSFGKGISAGELPSGMVRFFPLPSDEVKAIPKAVSEAPSSAGSTAPALLPETRTAEPGSYSSHAIGPRLLVQVLDMILSEIDRLHTLLQTLEIRFVGASVLVVYEGDAKRLAEALDRHEAKRAIRALQAANPDTSGGPLRSAFSDDGSGFSDEGDSEDEEDEDEDDVSLDGTREDAKMARRCPPVTVKLIDLAHTWLAEGEGPDLGVLKGLDTLKGLLEGRRREILGDS